MPSSRSTDRESGALSKSCAAASRMPQCLAPQMRCLPPPQPLDLPPLLLPPPSDQGKQMPKSCPARLHSPLERVSCGGFACEDREPLPAMDEQGVQTVLSLLQSLEVAWMHDYEPELDDDCDLLYDVPSMGCFQLDDLQITAA